VIRLKIFISSVQKELQEERIAIGRFLVMDDFLRECTVPRIFEDYSQPLRPNPKAYLNLLQQCQIYLLIIGTEYGSAAGNGLSATHEEYRLAQERKLPTLVCVKGADKDREEKESAFFTEIRNDKHTYSRFTSIKSPLEKVGNRLREHIAVTYDIVPRKEQVEQSKLTERAASDFERGELPVLSWDDLDGNLAREMMAAAEEQDKERIDDAELPRLLFSRGYLWKDVSADVLRPTIAGALLLAHNPSVALSHSRVQMDAYAGVDQTDDPIDSVFIDAPLPHAVEQAVAFIRRNTAHPLVVKGMKRQGVEAYPAEALRELIVNALAHRNYSDPGVKVSVEVFLDHLRVSSPGLPPGGQSVARVASGEARSSARNPLIVQGLSWLELMDERGSGIRRMSRVLEQHGNPIPLFKADHDWLVVEFAVSDRDAAPCSSDANLAEEKPAREVLLPKDAIFREVTETGDITTARCVQRLGIPRTTAYRILSALHKEGILERSGTGRGTKYSFAKLTTAKRK